MHMEIVSLLYFAIPLGLSVLFGFAIAGAKPDWPVWRSSLVSAAILPVPLLLLCVWLFAVNLFGSAEQCGVDACGMAMLGAMVLGAAAVALFAVGSIVNLLIHKLLARR
jgi:hypothetical protein